jgi:hypothetical protein
VGGGLKPASTADRSCISEFRVVPRVRTATGGAGSPALSSRASGSPCSPRTRSCLRRSSS